MKQTQWAKIRDYLEQNKTATVRELFDNCNINTPTKRISEMIERGEPIKSFWDKAVNAQGEWKRFKRYYMGDSNG